MNKEKGNIALLLIFVLVLMGGIGFLFYRYGSAEAIVQKLPSRFFPSAPSATTPALPKTPLSKTAQPAPSAKLAYLSAAQTALVNKYPGAYQTQSNTDGTYAVYYRGKVSSVTVDKNAWYTITLQPQDEKGQNIGKVITFTIPKIPPKINSATLGSNFQAMIDKGFNPINIKVTYKDNKFYSWESVK